MVLAALSTVQQMVDLRTTDDSMRNLSTTTQIPAIFDCLPQSNHSGSARTTQPHHTNGRLETLTWPVWLVFRIGTRHLGGGLTHPTPRSWPLRASSVPSTYLYLASSAAHNPLPPGRRVVDNLARSRKRIATLFLVWRRGSTSRVLSVTPPPQGRDKARSNRPVVIPHRIGGAGSGHGSELVGCKQLSIASQPWGWPARLSGAIGIVRVGAARHATVRHCDVVAHGSNKTRLALLWRGLRQPARWLLGLREEASDELDDECFFPLPLAAQNRKTASRVPATRDDRNGARRLPLAAASRWLPTS
jgi:hypothetical protein